MAKKSFSAGTTKSGVLNNDGGEKLREIQAKAQYNFKYIPKEKIIPNPKNEQYSQDGIEALKESILVNGLRHNLSVCMMQRLTFTVLFPVKEDIMYMPDD